MLNLRRLKNLDWIMMIAAILILTLGIVIIYSVTHSGNVSAGPNDAINQIIFAIVGIFLAIVLALLDYRAFKAQTGALYVGMIIMLVIVFVVGRFSHGAVRWIDLGFFRFQPSELAKIFMIIVLAKYFSEHIQEMHRLKHIVISGIYTAIPVILIALQPDLGTALVFCVIWLGMILVAGIRKIYLLAVAGGIFLFIPLAFKFLLKEYQRQRILTFLDPARDPLGAGYNVLQATIAVGSGGLFGRGLGHGPQSQLNFLPVQHTDFIFAVLAEELGFLGAAILLALFAVLILRIVRVARLSRDNFGTFIAIGVMTMISFQLVVNVGMNLGVMPVTGITLPLVSYGGSSLLTILICIGILQSIILRHKQITF